MAMSDPADSSAMHIAKLESSPVRTALPSRSMSSRTEDSSLGARSPPPEDGSQHRRSPSPLKPKHFERSPSVTDRQAPQPISPISSANEPAPSDGMTDVLPLPSGSISTQSGQVCR